MNETQCIASIELAGFNAAGEGQADHERRVAVSDLLESNHFAPDDAPDGPYDVRMAIEDGRLIIDVRSLDGESLKAHVFSMGPFRGVYKDYFMICDSYHEAVRDASLAQIEAIDMGRRGVHNEGSELLRERLKGKIEVDFETARRLFTLIGALHRRAVA